MPENGSASDAQRSQSIRKISGANQPDLKPANLSDYRMISLVGQGEFAQVYCAFQRSRKQLVAIKQIRHAKEHASQEAAILSQLDHPNIVRIQACSTTPSGDRLVLDYCEAGTLRSQITNAFETENNLRAGQLSLLETKELIGDILKGLRHIHHRGIFHGDLKPENILLTHQSPTATPRRSQLIAKISDFGHACFAAEPYHTSKDIGSPTYAAPERFAGHLTAASDLYAVGIMLYELLLGIRPFAGLPDALRIAHQTQPIPLPKNITPQAEQLLLKALHKQPKKRFATAQAMQCALEQLSEVIAEHPAHPHPLPQLPKAQDQPLSELPTIAEPPPLPTNSLAPLLTPIPSNGIVGPIQNLLKIPQGCCITTPYSLHVLTRRGKLMSMARFEQPCWIAVSPNGQWFTAVSKQLQQRRASGMVGQLSHHSGHRWHGNIFLTGRLLTGLSTQVLTLIALDNRHLLRVSTAPTSDNTFLEFFTRRGQFVGELWLNFRIKQIYPTAKPYQLIALSAATRTAPAQLMLVSLKPLQTRRIRLPLQPSHVSPLPWGYLALQQRQALVLDRSAQPVSWLTGIPSVSAIAAIDHYKLLFAGSHVSSQTSTNLQPQTKETTSLMMADIRSLDIGLIF
ncbi:MAG: serine/threonine-protein kinase [Cyanobacteria bacterium J06623_4]